MATIYTDIEINAPRTLVWNALINKDEWFQWNTFLFDKEPGKQFSQGQSLLLSLKRVGREKETKFQARILRVQSESCLQWISLAPGYRSEHLFELQDIGTNRTQYRHRERISGLLSRLFLLVIRQDEHNGMRRMAWDIKQYTEWLQSKNMRSPY